MLKALTTRIPPMVSWRTVVISPKLAKRCVVRRLVRDPKRWINKMAIGITISENKNSSQLRYIRIPRKMKIWGISRRGPNTIRRTEFCRVSRSEVNRLIRSPGERLEKKEKEKV